MWHLMLEKDAAYAAYVGVWKVVRAIAERFVGVFWFLHVQVNMDGP